MVGMAGQLQGSMLKKQKNRKNLWSVKARLVFKFRELECLLIKLSQMSRMDDWQVLFESKANKLAQLCLTPLEMGSKQEEDRPPKNMALGEMEEARKREARCISNYFAITSIPAFAHTLAAVAQILHIDPQPMLGKLDAVKIKVANASLESAEALQTTRSRLELCFSRRWRQQQSTVFLLIHDFVTPERSRRTRVLVINQRGLILQTFSNVDTVKGFIFLSKVLRISYTRLENLVVLSSSAGMANLDSMKILKEVLINVNVVMVSYGNRARLQDLDAKKLSAGRFFLMGSTDFKLAEFRKQEIIIWYVSQNEKYLLEWFLTRLSQILRCERFVSRFFKDFQYQHHQFNQKQFVLRLFSFYFNFVSLGRMEQHSEEDVKSAILDACTDQLLQKQREFELRSAEKQVHSFTTNSISLHCPVCKRKSKITCLKCCAEFGTKFGLCEVDCFEEFHSDRIKYAKNISKRRKEREREEQAKSDDNEEDDLAPNLNQVRTMAQLREKWQGAIENGRKEYAHFLRMSAMNFLPQKFVDRVNLLHQKIQQLSSRSLFKKPMVKKQE